MSDKPIYRVQFMNHGEVYEVYAQDVHQSSLYAFVEIEELLFGERSQVVVDPAEERLKSEFEGVKRSLIPMHSIIRIDEVEQQGTAKISEVKGGDKVTQFPSSIMTPPKN